MFFIRPPANPCAPTDKAIEQFHNVQVNHSSLSKGKKQTSNVRKNKMTNSYVNIPTNN